MGKQKINVVLETWDSWEIEGELVGVISKLQKIITDNPDYFNFKVSVDKESGYYGDSSTSISIAADRVETDIEFERRIAAENQRKEAAKLKAIRDAEATAKRERSLYESLKRKFEKEIKESN